MDDETRRHLNRIETTLTRIESSQTDGRQEIDDLIRGVTRLTKNIKEDGEERDERDHDVVERLRAIHKFIDEALPHVLEQLPENVLKAVEREIYKLRQARHEALQAGVFNEAPPLLPQVPVHRDPTGRLALPPAERDRETGRVPRVELEPEGDDGPLTPGQQRKIFKWLMLKWHWLVGGGGGAVLLHKAYDAIRHALGH